MVEVKIGWGKKDLDKESFLSRMVGLDSSKVLFDSYPSFDEVDLLLFGSWCLYLGFRDM